MSALIHASVVAYEERAVLLRGRSGSGKSSIALQLIALGCHLIADDQVILTAKDERLVASRPEQLPPLIEARGVGLLDVGVGQEANIRLIVDLDQNETERLPVQADEVIQGISIPSWRKVDAPHFPSAIFVYLRDHCRSV